MVELVIPETHCVCCARALLDSPYKNRRLCKFCGDTPNHNHATLYKLESGGYETKPHQPVIRSRVKINYEVVPG